jgi:PAS domain S-box-containing protein
MERLARGEDHEPLAVDRYDELGELAAKLNLLGEQIHEHRAQLLGEKARLEQTVQVLQDAVLFLNRDGQLVFANPAGEGFLGRSLDEALGHSLKHLLDADHPLVSTLDSMLSPGAPPGPHHLRLEPPGGKAREVRVSAYPVQEDGRFGGAVIAIQDLEAVKAVHSLVDYSARLADLGRLTSGVAHEVKNPLNAMAIHLEVFAHLPPDSPEARESLEVIGKEIRRLDRVVQGFLKFVRPQELRLQPVDVAAVFQDVVGLMEVEADAAAARVEVAVDPQSTRLMADADLLRHALVNLVQNAIQAMPEGGTFALRARPAPRSRSNSWWKIKAWASPRTSWTTFSPYYSTKADGNGIGLAWFIGSPRCMGDGRYPVNRGEGHDGDAHLPHLTPLDREDPT